MITLKEFKATHNLSDSAFKRLTYRVLAVRPYSILTVRVAGSSTEWEVLESDTLISALTDYVTFPNVKTKGQSTPEATRATVEVMPESHQSTLALLSAKTAQMTPYKRSETHLNGSQVEAVSAIELIASRIDQMDRENADKRASLDQRRQDKAALENLVTRLIEIGRSKELEARDLDDDAKQLQLEETQLKKQIEALRSKLSV